jgi:hypothetical protein
LLAIDPEFRAGNGAEPYTETTAPTDLPQGATSLSIVHEPGGTFLAIPRDSAGASLPTSTWRRSTSRAAICGGRQ